MSVDGLDRHGGGPRVAQIVEMLGERLDNPELCLLFDGHPGSHPFEDDMPSFGRQASPNLQRKMDDFR
ncbi:hypothetical protein [Nonomuraea africana]|uniref:Uncharacterized protein n=1 Tax=Nonomuraea africana TaxID=46171 RepID=A0ABR9KJ63_9ACTN|nr:hypothetical protein [Nonomuraea africana]MBE1562059.1 hypothetical protein [Nonomuraea africana]